MGKVPVCAVTGGRGFTARHLVLKLIHSGKWVVRIMDLAPEIDLEDNERSGLLGEALAAGKAHYACADLRMKSQVFEACKGVSVVFHMAAPDSSINSFKLHYDVTVSGTRNLIAACIEHNVKKLVYTSSPSVVFDGVHGIHNGDESMPYPDKHNDIYSETKAQAEALILSSNGKSGLVTCALRPSSIFGPGDRLLVPSFVAVARSGKMKFILGDGTNMFDFTYVENVAHAHICAEQALIPEKFYGEEVAAGKAYFITNMEPIRFWDFVSAILEGLGYARPKIHLPVKPLMPLAYLIEWTYNQLSPFGVSVPQFIPSWLRLVTSWHTFDCGRAVKLLGYKPIISLEEGITITLASFSHLRAESLSLETRDLEVPSKVHELLGSGKVADILLWRNEKKTFGTVLAIFCILYLLSTSAHSFISVAAKCLFLLTVALFIQSFLPSSIFGFQVPKLLSANFEVSEETVYTSVSVFRFVWNPMWDTFMALTKVPPSWLSFLKVILFVSFLNILAIFSFPTVVGTVMAIMFTFFYIYEQKENEIDGIVKPIVRTFTQCKAVVANRMWTFSTDLQESLKSAFRQ